MERTAVQSRDLAIIGYDAGSQILEVTFRGGGVYRYEKVPEKTYRDFMNAPSLGIFFRDHIREKYPFRKIN